MNISFSCISLNARGIRENTKRKSIFLFCKGEKAHFIFLQETHSKTEDEKFWVNQWGDKIMFDHGSNRSAGVAILFCNSPGKVLTSRFSNNGHWLISVLKIDDQLFFLTNVYGFNNLIQNRQLISDISKVIVDLKLIYPTAVIIMGGDFNMVSDEWIDRCPSRCNHSSYNPVLTDLCRTHNLLDPWRFKYPNVKQYSWFKPNDVVKSRIDFWLISVSIINLISDCCMSAASLTDHAVIKLSFNPPGVSQQKKGYWKFNSSLLKSQSFIEGIKATISNVMSDNSIVSYISKWEFLKFKMREYSVNFGKTFNKLNRLTELNIIKEINIYYSKTSLTDNDKQELQNLLNKLDEIYLCKAKGAFIRSRAKWIEDGERSTSYFCRLEKRRQEKLSIKALSLQGQVITDQASITKEVVSFYSNLYSSAFSLDDEIVFFQPH